MAVDRLPDLTFMTVTPFEGKHYTAMLLLRQAVLRTPLHLTFTLGDLEAESDQLHVALLDARSDTVLGCYLLKWQTDAAQLRQMAVDSAYQGFGLGAQLLRHAEQQALLKDKPRLVMQARLSAAPFYERFGYARLGASYTHVGIPHVDMEKTLASETHL